MSSQLLLCLPMGEGAVGVEEVIFIKHYVDNIPQAYCLSDHLLILYVKFFMAMFLIISILCN